MLNGAKTIARTLESLAIQRADFEHIVMDAGSKDSTREIVESYQGRYSVKWYQQKDRCLPEGVWNGMQHAQGDILCYLNADDQYLPWTLATVQSIFATYPEVEWITGIPNLYSEKLGIAELSPVIPIFPRRWIQRGWFSPGCMGAIQQESVFWRRSLWSRSRPEEILLKYQDAGDFNLWRRFAESASLRTVNAVLAAFTVSAGQLSWVRREHYLKECGLAPHQTNRPAWARVAFRMACVLGQGRVLRVPGISNE